MEDEAAELVQMNAACVGDVESQAVAVGGARSGALSSVGQYVRVYNTTGGHRDEIVSVDIALPKGSQGVRRDRCGRKTLPGAAFYQAIL